MHIEKSEKNDRYFDFKQFKLYINIKNFQNFITVIYCDYFYILLTRLVKKNIRIIVVAPSLRKALFSNIVGLFHHSTTIKLLLPLKSLNGGFRALKPQYYTRK
jgi:hypothetical protein